MRNHLVKLIEQSACDDESVVFLTGDLGFSVVESLQERLGPRFVNAGVSEANMMTMAAALSACGFRPYVYSIAPFVTMRCFEQIRNDVCYHHRRVRIVGVGAGFAYGNLGPSHHALEDAQILSALPNMMVLSPGSIDELEQLYHLTYEVPDAVYFRLGKDRGADVRAGSLTLAAPVSQPREGGDANLIVAGNLLSAAIEAADRLKDGHKIAVSVLSVPIVHPFPAQAVADRLNPGPVAVLYEGYDHNPLAQGVANMLLDGRKVGNPRPFRSLHAQRSFPKQVGGQDWLRAASGLDAGHIASAIRDLVAAR